MRPRTAPEAQPRKCDRRSCDCWRRCCSPRPSRSTRRLWQRGCRRASTCTRRSLRLQEDYATRGVNLVRINGKWTFRTATDLSWLLSKETTETRKLSRAAIETLAIIAYHQPVTRTEIEEIRGVTTSEGFGRRAAGDRLDPPARPAQGARPPGDLRHHRGVPVAFRARRGRRSAGPRGAQGLGPVRRAAAARLLGADAVRRSGACATTRTRWSRAISISGWRRRRSARPRSDGSGALVSVPQVRLTAAKARSASLSKGLRAPAVEPRAALADGLKSLFLPRPTPSFVPTPLDSGPVRPNGPVRPRRYPRICAWVQ